MVKKTLLILTALLIVAVCGRNGIQIKGDINGNGIVDNADLSELKYYLLDRREINDREKWAADINSDGNITLTDYVQLKRIAR